MMSSDDYQVQNVYRYSRKTFKKNRRDDRGSPREETIEIADSPRCEAYTMETPACNCETEPEGDIASILHKKCPVISLAQQQLDRLLDGTDKLLCENTRCCKSFCDFVCICKEMMTGPKSCRCIVIIFLSIGFFIGIFLGAASCGNYLGRFNSPLIGCIDSMFIPDSYPTVKDSYRCIV